jgi:hypothetical protein
MAFIPTISACLNGCTGITFNDTTGFYNNPNNLYGWNNSVTLWKTDANSNTPYVTAATISISLNGGTATTISVLDKIQDSVFPDFELYQYTPVDSTGSNFNLADGYYTITYTITDSNDLVYTTDTVFVVYCNVACCVANKAAAVANELCNDCDSQAYEDFLLADGILQALKATAESLGIAEFTKLLNKLQKLCGTSTTGGCGCGCS